MNEETRKEGCANPTAEEVAALALYSKLMDDFYSTLSQYPELRSRLNTLMTDYFCDRKEGIAIE